MQGHKRQKGERKLTEDDDYSWYRKKMNGRLVFLPLLSSHTRQIFAGGKVASAQSQLVSPYPPLGGESLAFVSPDGAHHDAFLGAISEIV